MTQANADKTVLRGDARTGSTTTGGKGAPAVTPRVLKSRFVLDQKLGSGGMGTVYRAKDLRKVEARDRFPFVAIKVLNADVREHPEAFIALEREASKSQGLSHPNIVSIFDFDKDGDVPFITMELLQGRELADLLHAYPNGLPDELAWEVIRGLCAGLRYAHENGVVHADFKPGNVFVTGQNVAKILDFGIARAAQVQIDHGEDTVFDPARLGALTPVYASLEMIKGDNPEIRDDIYSLAVVIYMILTGHHPYGRLSADEALNEGLEPERPKQINSRQWRVLAQALSFHRQSRPMDVAFMETQLFGTGQSRSRVAWGLVAALALSTGTFWMTEGAQIQEVREEVRQTTLLDAQVARVSALLEEASFDETWRANIDTEFPRLHTLDVEKVYVDTAKARLREVLRERIGLSGWRDAVVFLQLAETRAAPVSMNEEMKRVFGFAYAQLSEALLLAEEPNNRVEVLNELDALSRQARITLGEDWLEGPQSQLVQRLTDAALTSFRAGSQSRAKALIALVSHLEPTATGIAEYNALRQEAQKAQLSAARKRSEAQQRQALAAELGDSCLRLDVDDIAEHYPQKILAAPARRLLDEHVTTCVADMAAVDIEQAQSLREATLARFTDLPKLTALKLDPCALPGVQSCQDQLRQSVGPSLIVVRDDAEQQMFAVTQEISGSSFNSFCAEAGTCAASFDERLPVTGVAPDQIEEFARWLTEQSGHQYRLPSEEEWMALADLASALPRACGGLSLRRAVQRTGEDLTLKSVLNNVSELVRSGDSYVIAGGNARSGSCDADYRQPLDGTPDEFTGFRLLRELS